MDFWAPLGESRFSTTEPRMKPKSALSSPYASMLPAANDQYHAVCAIQEFGVVRYAGALAAAFMETGVARSELDAVALAHHEIDRTFRIAEGVLVNRIARQKLQKDRAPARSSPLQVPQNAR